MQQCALLQTALTSDATFTGKMLCPCICALTRACELKTAGVVADLAILIFQHRDDIHPGLDSWGSQPATALPRRLHLSLTTQQP